MPLKNEAALKEKLEQVRDLLERPESLAANTEGSKVIIVVVKPKEESKAMNELKRAFDGKFASVNCAKQLIRVANDYGYEQLREDLEFFGFDDFSQKIKEEIVNEILRACEKSDIEFVVLHRVGILNGVTRLNPIIEDVSGKLKKPLLIIYPGKRESHALTFLNSRHRTSVYRAEVI